MRSVLVVTCALGLGACFDEGDSGGGETEGECEAGYEDCECLPNLSCFGNLECVSGLCVPADATVTADGSGSADDDGSGDDTAGTAEGSTTGGASDTGGTTTGDGTQGSGDGTTTTASTSTDTGSGDTTTSAGTTGGTTTSGTTSTTDTGTTGGASEPNIMFVTSMSHVVGGVGGLGGADGLCATAATNAGLAANTYVAFLSTSTVHAKDRLTGARGWVRTDGLPFADTVDDMVTGYNFYPPNRNELGDSVGQTVAVTGSDPDGTRNAVGGDYCDDYQTQDGSAVRAGHTSLGGGSWISESNVDCDSSRRLYCFGTDHDYTVTVAPISSRRAFVSTGTWDPSTGIGAADTLCGNEATAASLPGTYQAMLATAGASAISRFNTSGDPWVRWDGVAMLPSAADYNSAFALNAPVLQAADGTPTEVDAWTGSNRTFNVGTSTCTSWSSNATDGQVGSANATTAAWFGGSTPSCSQTNTYHLYCFQE